jgi:hypothetical protein
MTSRLLSLICFFALTVCRPVLAADATTPVADLTLRVEMDRDEFLPGEPLVVGLSIENVGSDAFEDLGKLNPRRGYMGLSLIRNGKEMPWTSRFETWFYSKEGTQLAPGSQLCEVVDLLDYYGTRSNVTKSGRVFNFLRALPPGAYVLRSRFRARSGVRADLSPVFVEGNEAKFVIRDAAAIPDSEVGALDLLQIASDSGLPRWAPKDWRDIREGRLKGSRYFESLARAYVAASDSVDAVALADDYVSHGGGKLSAASVLQIVYERLNNGLDESESWLSKASRDDVKGSFSCFLGAWKENIVQARKYPHSGH